MVDPASPVDRDDLAIELALGLLDGAQRAVALRLCLSDPAFAAEVEDWALGLSPLLAAIPPVVPPARVWNVIAARIGADAAGATRRRLRWWRGGTLLSGALAASLALVIITRPAPTPLAAPVAISQLVGTDPASSLAISYDPARGVLRLGPVALAHPSKQPELWVIPADGVPRSLGVVAADGDMLTVEPAMRPLLGKGATLAVTMEDPATAPHRAPTAAPVLTGKISII